MDTEGVELPDITAARREAIRAAGEILASEGEANMNGNPWRMTVADDTAVTVLTVTFAIEVPTQANHPIS